MSDPAKLPRRERERLRHRQEILDAARKVLASRGLDGVTLEQIAREAEFAVGSIYRHFSSKEQLIEELLVDLTEPFFEELAELGQQGLGFEARLDAFVDLVLTRHIESEPFLMALLAAPGAFPAPGSAAGRQLHEIGLRYISALDALLAQGQSDGVIAEGDRTPTVIALGGLIDSLVRWRMFSGQPLDADGTRRVLAVFLDGARRRGGK